MRTDKQRCQRHTFLGFVSSPSSTPLKTASSSRSSSWTLTPGEAGFLRRLFRLFFFSPPSTTSSPLPAPSPDIPFAFLLPALRDLLSLSSSLSAALAAAVQANASSRACRRCFASSSASFRSASTRSRYARKITSQEIIP